MARHPHPIRNTPVLGNKAHFPRTLGESHGDHGAVEGAILFHQRDPGAKARNEALGAHPPRRLRRGDATLDVAVNVELAYGLALTSHDIFRQQALHVILHLRLVLLTGKGEVLRQFFCGQEQLVHTIFRLRHRWLSPCPERDALFCLPRSHVNPMGSPPCGPPKAREC